MIHIKRAYDEPKKKDGVRVLIDRMWPRGVRKEDAQIDLWLKEAAPSSELRKWFGHEASRWEAFQERYRAELDHNREAVDRLLDEARRHTVTLVYAARDTDHNNAVVLRDYLANRLE